MDVITVLTQAMNIEKQGEEFYMEAAARSEDPESAQMFQNLASDEQQHYDYIRRQLESHQAGESWIKIPELDSVEAIDAQAPVFPKGLAPVKDLPSEPSMQDALLFGLGAEVKSFELYSKSAKEADSEEAKKMFTKLAGAERGHFDILMMRYESLFDYPH